MQYTDLLKENEALKLQIADYETRYKPVYEKYMADVKEKALAEYGLQADAVWIDRLTADNEEEIKEQAKAIAIDLRISQRNQFVDAGMGNGAVVRPKQFKPYDVGVQTYQRLKASGRLNKHITSIKIDAPPVKAKQTPQKQDILKRFFGR